MCKNEYFETVLIPCTKWIPNEIKASLCLFAEWVRFNSGTIEEGVCSILNIDWGKNKKYMSGIRDLERESAIKRSLQETNISPAEGLLRN